MPELWLAADVFDATREVQWNVTYGMVLVMYTSLALGLAMFAWGFWRRIRVWLLGQPEPRFDRLGERFKRLLKDAVFQRSVLRKRLAGIMHALIYFSFAVLLAATAVVYIHHDLGIPIMRGYFYLYFQSITVNVFGFLLGVGLFLAYYRRYGLRVPELEHRKWTDPALLAILFLIQVTGFMVSGIRIVVTEDPWALWRPFSYMTGIVMQAIIPGTDVLRSLHAAMWLFHMLLWHALLALIPYTKLMHIVTSPLNIFFGHLDEPTRKSTVQPIDFEDDEAVETLGVNSVFDLTWKQLLDLDACTECGRCQAACPAFAEGKPLSPKRVILDLRDFIHRNEDKLVTAHAAKRRGREDVFAAIMAEMPPLAGDVIKQETLWACTTCRACEENCPVSIEHVTLILQMRQNLAMEQANVPEGVAESVNNIEVREHPFRGASSDRTEWFADLDEPVPQLAEVDEPEEVEVLYWVGCGGSVDERMRKIPQAMVRIMNRAGVKFAVLGSEEQCTGDPMRRTGNEYHFDMLARANIETLNQYKVKRIVTHCPHCLQTIGNEYRKYGGFFDVVHHSQFVMELIESGRLKISNRVGEKLTFHDPCYLGRYNGIFDAPRLVIEKLGAELVEMQRSGRQSFCCGAGGGHAFYEDEMGGKINRNRAREAVATGADTIATGCPFCLNMLEDGVRGVTAEGEKQVRVRDLVELIDEALTAEEQEAHQA